MHIHRYFHFYLLPRYEEGKGRKGLGTCGVRTDEGWEWVSLLIVFGWFFLFLFLCGGMVGCMDEWKD